MRKYGIAFFLLLCSVVGVAPELNAQVMQVGLLEMIQSSGIIFSGTVIEVKGERDERGDIVTLTTFRVETPVRGVTPGSVTIKQFGGSTSEGSMVLPHMRYFTEGERVLVMMYPPSELGFTSPIGMGQGAWTVTDNGMIAGVTRDVVKDMEGLASQYNVYPDAAGQVPLTNMISLIQAATRGGK